MCHKRKESTVSWVKRTLKADLGSIILFDTDVDRKGYSSILLKDTINKNVFNSGKDYSPEEKVCRKYNSKYTDCNFNGLCRVYWEKWRTHHRILGERGYKNVI